MGQTHKKSWEFQDVWINYPPTRALRVHKASPRVSGYVKEANKIGWALKAIQAVLAQTFRDLKPASFPTDFILEPRTLTLNTPQNKTHTEV